MLESHSELQRERLGHGEGVRTARAIVTQADHPEPGPVLGDAMVRGVEDTPLNVVLHALQLGDAGLPPYATLVGGHPIALLHEERQGSASSDGLQDFVEQGGSVVPRSQLLAPLAQGWHGGPAT